AASVPGWGRLCHRQWADRGRARPPAPGAARAGVEEISPALALGYSTGGSHMNKPTILVVNPNTSEAMTVAIDRIAWEAARTSANIVTRRSLQGRHTIEGPLDAVLGAAGMLEVVGAYPYSFDAVVVACFGDPGVEALRLLVRVPVIGIGAASFTQA